jgi:hypothetical protein
MAGCGWRSAVKKIALVAALLATTAVTPASAHRGLPRSGSEPVLGPAAALVVPTVHRPVASRPDHGVPEALRGAGVPAAIAAGVLPAAASACVRRSWSRSRRCDRPRHHRHGCQCHRERRRASRTAAHGLRRAASAVPRPRAAVPATASGTEGDASADRRRRPWRGDTAGSGAPG